MIAAVNGGSIYALTNLQPSWTPTASPTNAHWWSVASSADGTKLVAAAGGQLNVGGISVSGDAGATWRLTDAPQKNWAWVASSADGTKLAGSVGAYGGSGSIYVSSDSGATWTATGSPILDWGAVTLSADGSKLVAVATSGQIYFSTNSASTWNLASGVPSLYWYAAGASADGTKVVAGAYHQPIYFSTNSGGTWTPSTGSGQNSWNSFAASADGTKFFAAAGGSGYPAGIWVSADHGASWVLTDSALPLHQLWNWIACSADGMKLVAAVYNEDAAFGGPLFTSTNGGASWDWELAPNKEWSAVSCTADGARLVAAPDSDAIYTRQSTSAPVLRINNLGSDALVSWTVPSIPSVLQQSPDPSNTSWADAPATPLLNYSNLQYQVTTPATNSAMFYHLIRRQ
jgi:hypothetical protein